MIKPSALSDVLRSKGRGDDLTQHFRPVHHFLLRRCGYVVVAVGRAQCEREAWVFDFLWYTISDLETILSMTNKNLSLGECIL